MTDPQVGLMMLVLFLFVIMLGFPIAFSLIAMGVGFGYYAYATPTQLENIFDNRIFTLLVQKTFEVTTNDVTFAYAIASNQRRRLAASTNTANPTIRVRNTT